MTPAASVYQSSARKMFRKPGPATSTRSTCEPSFSCSAAPSRSAISRGGAFRAGARSIAALVEKSPKPAFFGRSSVGALLGAGPPLRSSAAAASTAERRSSIGVTSVMVGLAREDLVGAEELLEQHHARELVRERHRAEREPVIAAVQPAAVRPADEEADVAARLAALLQPAGERL